RTLEVTDGLLGLSEGGPSRDAPRCPHAPRHGRPALRFRPAVGPAQFRGRHPAHPVRARPRGCPRGRHRLRRPGPEPLWRRRPVSPPAPPAFAPSPRVSSLKDEPSMSINRSYPGYGTLVYVGPDPPAPGYVTRYGAAVTAQGYTRAPAPARRGFRLFGWRR